MPNKEDQPSKSPSGPPELSDEAKKMLEDQREVPLPELDKEVDEPGESEQESVAKLLSEPITEPGKDTEPLEPSPPSNVQLDDGKKHRLKRFFAGYWRHKKWTIPLTILVIIGVILAVPWTRYRVFGAFVTKPYSVKILDSKTHAPLSDATVLLDGQIATTDADGLVKVRAHVGQRTLQVSKKYYRATEQQIFVGLASRSTATDVSLVATGRQVPLTIVDKLSDKPVAGAVIKVLDTSAKTDANGKATIVLPTKTTTEKAVVTANGYNLANVEVVITDKAVPENTFSLVPAGRAYFLSNRSGTVDVISANFDGSNRKTVASGTGSEDAQTQLFVSPDQKYILLYAKRNNSKSPKLYNVDIGSGNVSEIDTMDASFVPIGWAGQRFVYGVTALAVRDWQPHQQLLKSYAAASGKSTTLDQSDASGTQSLYVHQTLGFGTASLIGEKIIYTKQWASSYANQLLKGKQDQILSSNADGSSRQVLKGLPVSPDAQYAYIDAVQPKPNVIYFSVANSSGSTYYIYQNGNISNTNTISSDDFFKTYPTYFVSPDGQRAFWTERRDGQSVMFVGDENAANEAAAATLDDYTTYGWAGNGYLLVAKNSSQLYVLPSSGLPKGKQPLKISDFYGTATFH